MLSAAQAAGLSKRVIFAGALVLAGIAILYRDVVPELIHSWSTDDNYSHGYLIPPIAAYLAWERRRRFASTPTHPSGLGLIVILVSLLVLAIGILGVELFLTRVSLIGAIAGVVVFLFGWARLRVMLFPIAVLLLMVPLPAIVFNQ